MKKHPPADLSWRAAIKLEDELNSGMQHQCCLLHGFCVDVQAL